MVLGEALAHGLPIVATRAGAAAETVPVSAALKVEPGDAAGLAAALRQVIGDAALRPAWQMHPGLRANACRNGSIRHGGSQPSSNGSRGNGHDFQRGLVGASGTRGSPLA